jgi:hypothetical protein
MMDIRKLDVLNWLTLDKNYMDEHRVRDALLREKRDQVLQCLPESVDACHEALEEVSHFLCQRFPTMFETTMHEGNPHIQNRMTGESFNICGSVPDEPPTNALEAAVRLTMEDLSILKMNEDDEYYLYVGYPLCSSAFVNQSPELLVRVSSPRDGQLTSASDGQFPVYTSLYLYGINK